MVGADYRPGLFHHGLQLAAHFAPRQSVNGNPSTGKGSSSGKSLGVATRPSQFVLTPPQQTALLGARAPLLSLVVRRTLGFPRHHA